MTRRDDLQTIRKMLLQRRDGLATVQRGVDSELESLKAADRDAEYEETAQVAAAEYTLATLHENHLQEIRQIDAALSRIDEGTYGACADCELEIPRDRLMVVPYSVRCADCATTREGRDHRHASL